MTNEMLALSGRDVIDVRTAPGIMSLVSSCNSFAQPWQPPLARWRTRCWKRSVRLSATAGYRGPGAVQEQTRPYPSVAWESRSVLQRTARRAAGRVLTIALCKDGQFIPREAAYVHHQRSRCRRADLTSCWSVITARSRSRRMFQMMSSLRSGPGSATVWLSCRSRQACARARACGLRPARSAGTWRCSLAWRHGTASWCCYRCSAASNG